MFKASFLLYRKLAGSDTRPATTQREIGSGYRNSRLNALSDAGVIRRPTRSSSPLPIALFKHFSNCLLDKRDGLDKIS